jgi:hypothetical protein
MNVSVALATFNGSKYLPEQLESLSRQTLKPCELQIGDDGSTDDTMAILQRFAETAPFPVNIVRNDPRLGCGLNFFATARRCSGDWIAFCDQDDVWSADKLSRCRTVSEEGPDDLLLIVHNASVTDESLIPSGELDSGPFGTFAQGMLPHSYIAHGFREVFKRDLLRLLPNEPYMGWLGDPHSHDVWVSVTASIAGSIATIEDSLALYRRHAATVTSISTTTLEQVAEQSFRNNGLIYERNADAFRTFARDLLHSDDPALRKGLDLVEAYAEMLATRAVIYLSPKWQERAKALLQMVRLGAYGSKHAWQFRPRSLAKDVVQVGIGR